MKTIRYSVTMRAMRRVLPMRWYTKLYRLRAHWLGYVGRRVGRTVCPCGKTPVAAGATVECEGYLHSAKCCHPRGSLT